MAKIRLTRRRSLIRSDRNGWALDASNGKSVAIGGEGMYEPGHARDEAILVAVGQYSDAAVKLITGRSAMSVPVKQAWLNQQDAVRQLLAACKADQS